MTELHIQTAGGLKFYTRPGTSDYKTVLEVIGRRSYFRRDFIVEPDDNWIDLGANIGAFTVLAASAGAFVEAYEPDPMSFEMLKLNIELNGLKNVVTENKAVVADFRKAAPFYISKTKQFWRNSLLKNWGGGQIEVACCHFADVIGAADCVKMDVEGAEMAIVEGMKVAPRKLVLEWSFDVDDSLSRYRRAIAKLQDLYQVVHASKINEKYDRWQKSWFPPCKLIWCFNPVENML